MTPDGKKVTVVVVDDHTLFREGIKELLCTDPDFEIVADGASGDDAIKLVGLHRPDVVLLDVEMPGPDAPAVVEQLRRSYPETSIAILTMHEKPLMVQELLNRGAAAYLVKTIGREQLIAAVRAVARQRENVLISVPRNSMNLDTPGAEPSLLSARESEVLQLVAQALSNSQIASRLYISEGTVKRHLTNIYAKLGATSRVDALKRAMAAGVIDGMEP